MIVKNEILKPGTHWWQSRWYGWLFRRYGRLLSSVVATNRQQLKIQQLVALDIVANSVDFVADVDSVARMLNVLSTLSAVLYGAKDLQRSRPCWIQRCRQCVPDFTFNKLYITGTSVKTGYNDEVTKRAVDTDTKLSHTRVAAMRKTWPETVVAVITLQCSKCEITTTLLQHVEGGT